MPSRGGEMTAKHIMTTNIETVTPETSLADAVNMLLMREISGMPVVDGEGRLMGVVSEKDVFRLAFSGKVHESKVADVMTTKVVSFPPDADIRDIAKVLAENVFRTVPIVEDGKIIGIVSRADILEVAL
ncbi:MAG: CBS domain-containing protein [Candidatus Omnitrophica bacterium]|nr:CBS domain-containing protein [Candidatus Omnitrophota bacterium]